MGFVSDLKNYISYNRYKRSYAKMLNGQIPVFNSFGKNIYAYDILRNAIAINCMEISMLEPRHIRYDSHKETQVTVNDDINRLLTIEPNPYMTPSDFLHKCNWLYETTDNCYIYPTYEKEYIKKDYYKKKYTGFYPLDPSEVEFLQDERTERIYIRFTFDGGYVIDLPYSNIIHWKKNVTSYDIAGGFEENYADKSLINLLNADNTAIQGIDKAVKSKLTINGILKINTYSSNDVQDKVVADFEEKIKRGQNGIIPLDVKSDYIPMNIDPKIIDKNTMEFIQKRILARPGVPLEIYNRKFTEEDYQGYYEVTLSSRVKSFGEAFTKCLFTPEELARGNKIIAYNQGLRYASLAHKMQVVDIISRVGVLTNNQIADVFGFPAYEGGEVRMVSLNYMDANYITDYQLREVGKSYENKDNEVNGNGTNGSK